MKSTLGQEYHSFSIQNKVVIEESDGHCPPAFINGKNEAFDKYYRRISKPVEFTDSMKDKRRNIYTQEEYPKYFDTTQENTLCAPNPLDFETYADYEKALNAWYTDKVKCYCSALLPTPISGSLYSPVPAKFFATKPKAMQFRTFKAAQWPLLPTNYFDMLRRVEENKEIDPDEEFPEQYPKREVIYMKHHISSDPQWMGQQIPQEPVPEFYDTLEEYEAAYRRWATLAGEAMTVKIPTVEEFEKIANIDVVRREFKGHPQENLEKPPNEFLFDTRFLQLSKTEKIDEEKLAGIVEKLSKPFEDDEDLEEEHKYQVFLHKVDREEFIAQMKEYGHYINESYTKEPITPANFYASKLDDTNDITEKIFNNVDMDIDFITEIAALSLSVSDTMELFEIRMSDDQVSTRIIEVLTKQDQLQEYIRRSYRTEETRFNSSRLLYNLITLKSDESRFKILFGSMNNMLLESTVNLLCVASEFFDGVYEVIKSDDERFQTINRLYLFTALTKIFKDEQASPIFEFIRKECQKLSLRVAKLLKNDEFRDFLQEELKKDEMNEGTHAALMMISIESIQVHRVLFRESFIEWINSFSESKNGIIFIENLSHSPALLSLAFLFMRVEIAKNAPLFEKLTQQTCFCLRNIIYTLLEICQNNKLSFNGTEILKIFEKISSSKRECLSTIVAPIVQIVASPSIISNINTPEYQTILSKTVIAMGNGISTSSREQFSQQLKALMILAPNTACRTAMSTNKTFMSSVISHLTESDMNTNYLSWKFFKILMRDPKTIDNVLDSDSNKQAFNNIQGSKNAFALRKLLNFSIYVWKEINNADIQKKWANLLYPSVAAITAKYIYKNKRFPNDLKTQKSLETFVNFIITSKQSCFKEIKEACQKAIDKETETKRTKRRFGSFFK